MVTHGPPWVFLQLLAIITQCDAVCTRFKNYNYTSSLINDESLVPYEQHDIFLFEQNLKRLTNIWY